MERTRVLFGVCRQCKAVCEKHVDPDKPFEVKQAIMAHDLIPRDLYLDDTSKWPVDRCSHHRAWQAAQHG